jgi:hypothetical protein
MNSLKIKKSLYIMCTQFHVPQIAFLLRTLERFTSGGTLLPVNVMYTWLYNIPLKSIGKFSKARLSYHIINRIVFFLF